MSRLFFSYSHKDEKLRDQLEVQLAVLKREGAISTWHDRRIMAGDVLGQRIDEELERADIILLLISPDFLASDYCHDMEMQCALARHAERSARVIPVPAAVRLAALAVRRVAGRAHRWQAGHEMAGS